jgi:hypothetical protein
VFVSEMPEIKRFQRMLEQGNPFLNAIPVPWRFKIIENQTVILFSYVGLNAVPGQVKLNF